MTKSGIEKFLVRRELQGDIYVIKDRTFGLFYHNKTIHIAEYVPYKVSPYKCLCGHHPGGWAAHRGDLTTQKCENCYELLEKIALEGLG